MYARAVWVCALVVVGALLVPVPATTAGLQARITLSAPSDGAVVDQPFSLRGRVRGTGKADNKTILLQRRHSGAWRTVKRLTRRDDGRYRFRVRVGRAGHQQFRSVVRRNGLHLGTSRRRTVQVAEPDPLVVWTVGDLCDNDDEVPGCQQVADLVAADPTSSYFVPLGDVQYNTGSPAEFATYYHPKVGARLNPITRPIPGNHDYETPGAGGYFGYFGPAAGDPSKGYYSTTEGNWKLIFLNSNCNQVAAGCNYASAQARWLDRQLRRRQSCEIIFVHHPPISDGAPPEAYPSGTPSVRYFFRYAVENHAELFLSGHHHSYQRFSPRNASLHPAAKGVRPIVAGVGGEEFSAFGSANRSEYRQNTDHGAVRLSLTRNGYSGAFVNISGVRMDTFSGSCRR